MRTLAVATCALMLFTGAAFSQYGSGGNANTLSDSDKAEAAHDAAEKKKQAELDAAYKASLKKTKAPAVAADPWATVRPADTPAAHR